MDTGAQLELVGRLAIAMVLGALVGIEREQQGHSAGLRTMAAVSMGSCLFALIGVVIPHTDPTRIAAQVVTGVGFLGAGSIVRSGPSVHGLTTAASIWLVAAIGMAAGFGLHALAVAATILMLAVLVGLRLVERRLFRGRHDAGELQEHRS